MLPTKHFIIISLHLGINIPYDFIKFQIYYSFPNIIANFSVL